MLQIAIEANCNPRKHVAMAQFVLAGWFQIYHLLTFFGGRSYLPIELWLGSGIPTQPMELGAPVRLGQRSNSHDIVRPRLIDSQNLHTLPTASLFTGVDTSPAARLASYLDFV
jgi:hypothetical protein